MRDAMSRQKIVYLFFTVDGGWSDWSAWNSCNETCGTGFQERFRNCTQPAPENGGKHCKGEAQQEQLCQLPPCPGK